MDDRRISISKTTRPEFTKEIVKCPAFCGVEERPSSKEKKTVAPVLNKEIVIRDHKDELSCGRWKFGELEAMTRRPMFPEGNKTRTLSQS